MTDTEMLERLFKRHYRQMYRLADMLLHDDAGSKDVVHDVFAQLLASSRCPREETAETYLLTCVRNRCLNVIRDRQTQERVERLYQLEADADLKLASASSQLEEELKALDEGIEHLEPSVCRDVIVQHYRDGLTFKEIAHRQGVSETTIYKHLRRALSQLRRQLKKFAALLIGILMLSGIAYAAIRIIRTGGRSNGEDLNSPTQEMRGANSQQQPPQHPRDTLAVLPKLYDNVPLEQILSELSATYHIQVDYHDDASRRLRLFYQWKPEYTIEKVVEMLNHFETLQLRLEDDTLRVSSTVTAQP